MEMQAVAVLVTLHKTITMCSLYLPLNEIIIKVYYIIGQLPQPFLRMGILINVIWGSWETNRKGKTVETLINKKTIMFTKPNVHPAMGSYSAINLYVTQPPT